MLADNVLHSHLSDRDDKNTLASSGHSSTEALRATSPLANSEPGPNERAPLISPHARDSARQRTFRSITFNSRLGSLVLAVAGTLLLLSTTTESAKAKFWCFVAFEVAVGVYCESLRYGDATLDASDLRHSTHRPHGRFVTFGFDCREASSNSEFCSLALRLSGQRLTLSRTFRSRLSSESHSICW